MDGIEIDERIEVKRLYKTTRYLHYVMKFIIRSRILFSAINDNSDHDDFANKLHGKLLYIFFPISTFNLKIKILFLIELLEMFIKMIACPTDLLKSEGALLKNLHIIATDLMQVFDPVRLR